jgi:hypothetical protein
MTVRNAMEEIHGGGNLLDRSDEGGEDGGLTDVQMREINRIVRNGVASALYAIEHPEDPACLAFTLHQRGMIPDYWEPAELHDDLAESTIDGERLTRMVSFLAGMSGNAVIEHQPQRWVWRCDTHEVYGVADDEDEAYAFLDVHADYHGEPFECDAVTVAEAFGGEV